MARLLLWVAPLSLVAVDLGKRKSHLAMFGTKEQIFYAASAALSVGMWVCLSIPAARRRGFVRWIAIALMSALALLAVGGQLYTFHRYHVYLDHQAILVGTSMMPSVGQQLWSDRIGFALALLPPAAAALLVPTLLRRLAPTKRPHSRMALAGAALGLLGAFAIPPAWGGEQGQPPDVLYLSAMGHLAYAHYKHNPEVERLHPERRHPPTMASMHARRDRNLVLIVTESVRAQDTCLGSDVPCETTPFTQKEAPNRIVFRQMHALDSTTAISLAVLWNGLVPESARTELHTAPLLWEYAHAAGYDAAYFTAQNLLFGNSGTWLEGIPVSKLVSATMIDPTATMEIGADDSRLIDAALREMKDLREPFVSVVHLSNTHFPYAGDENDAPFLAKLGDSREGELLAHYRDAIYRQDKHVARFLRDLRASTAGQRTLVVFVSDHGEQLHERGQVGHTFTLHEEELRVPAWIDAPSGILTDTERAKLTSLADSRLTQLDVLPTLLDLLGILDQPEAAPYIAKLGGRSLLRGGSPVDASHVLTNCSDLWACAYRNWGAMKGSKKLFASQWDRAWKCYDLDEDPNEQRPRASGCEDLLSVAERRGRPFTP